MRLVLGTCISLSICLFAKLPALRVELTYCSITQVLCLDFMAMERILSYLGLERGEEHGRKYVGSQMWS